MVYCGALLDDWYFAGGGIPFWTRSAQMCADRVQSATHGVLDRWQYAGHGVAFLLLRCYEGHEI